jgi:uncharacterized protein DUF6348
MPELDSTKMLRELLEGHSISVQPVNRALAVGSVTMSANIVPRHTSQPNHMVQLNINLKSPHTGSKTLIESFAGWGANEQEAIQEAWQKFARASFHVLAEVFLEQHSDQVEWEEWGDTGNKWQVCLGPLLRLSFCADPLPDMLVGDLLDKLKNALLSNLTRECHWLRFYYMRKASSCLAIECLLDNDTWAEGEKLLTDWNWPDGFYSVRLFLVLLPRLNNR